MALPMENLRFVGSADLSSNLDYYMALPMENLRLTLERLCCQTSLT
jgi:hypothetical protein